MNYPGYPQTPPAAPQEKAVTIANRNFIKSPLILIAIICYTIYAGIAAINVLPFLKILPYLLIAFELIDKSVLLFFAIFSAYLSLFVPIIVAIGLWRMYLSNGTGGAGAVRSGIGLYVALIITMISSLLMYIILQYEYLKYLPDALDEYLVALALQIAHLVAYLIFGLVAISSLSAFARAVEYTSTHKRPNTKGVTKAGILILIFCGLTFLAVMESVDKLGIEMFGLILSYDNESLAAAICRLASLVLFGISALNYTKIIERADAADAYLQQHPNGAPQQPVQQAPQQPAPTVPQEAAETITCSNCGKKLEE